MKFAKTPRIRDEAVTRWRVFYSRCKRYRVSQCISKIEGREKDQRREDPETGEVTWVPGKLKGYGVRWYAEYLDGRSWKMVSKDHRKRGPAELACAKHAREN